MSSLIETLRDDIDAQLGRKGEKLLNSVEIYGGEFTAAEISKYSTASPVCLIACLGWTPSDGKSRIASPARSVKFGFFILTKTQNRTTRMLQAVSISERLCGFLQDWKLSSQVANGCVGKFTEPTAENLYGRATDSAGLGLWLVRASIDVSYCGLREPAVSNGGSIEQYMASLIAPTVIIDTNAITAPADAADIEPSATLEQNINLNGNNIGADDGN